MRSIRFEQTHRMDQGHSEFQHQRTVSVTDFIIDTLRQRLKCVYMFKSGGV